MNVVTRWFSQHRRLPLMAGFLAVVIPFTFVARSTTDGSGTAPGQLVLIGLLLLALAVAVAQLGVMLAGVDPEAAVIAAGLASDPEQQRLLTRWLQRTRWARNVGGLAGLAWWVIGTSLNGDILLYGVGGVAIGSMAAQLHHVRRPIGPRTASLDRRSVADYIPANWQRRMIVVALMAVAMIVGGIAITDARTASKWGAAALLVIGAAHLVQRRVATRPRPALTSGLQQADDLARELAIDRGLAQPATYAALAMFAHGSLAFEASLGGVATAMSVGAWLYALYAWWHNRRLGLDIVIDQRRPTVAAA